ncbi:MAG: DUF565 domain-containing protein [Aphanocapsa feldmannii 288cV]|nr:MAG: DUF565 domain-containing protein [Aphanocapsa feldmannii 288cV]
MAAFACVLFGELLIRQRPRLLRQADRLWLGLIDMLRIGFLSGLILDGFRFSS